ncbi:GlsB/YeaQ/YmgE family stress response membrane protein [Streptomyces sp. NPDC048448]|uniref:GlsB/YeaQ/YmgE family stress response membrane protein n=1 Tax=unclassified Streptomyces TaxID=2593676 RepID=UPI003423C8F5
MEISGVATALVIGLLGHLVLPGRQHIGVLWTFVVGIAAALLGTAIAGVFDVAGTKSVDWIELAVQIALASFGVAGLDRLLGRPSVSNPGR